MPTLTAPEPVEETEAEEVVAPIAPFAFPLPVRLLTEILKPLRAVLPRKSTLPILGNILVERIDGVTRFTATDLDRWLTYSLASTEPTPASDLGRKLAELRHARENGSVALDAAPLALLLKSCDASPGYENLAVHHNRLELPILGQMVADLRCHDLPASEFPITPEVGGTEAYLTDPARLAILDSLPFASTDETRYVLNGVCVEVESGAIVATDGRRMIVTLVPPDHLAGFGVTRIIPSSIVPLFKTPLTSPILSTRYGYFRARSGPWSFTGKFIDGNYPNWRQVMPADANAEIAFTPEELRRLVNSIRTLPVPPSDKNPDTIHLQIQPGNGKATPLLRVSNTSWANNGAFAEVTARWVGKPYAKPRHVALNRAYLLDTLHLGLTHFRIIDEMSPVVFASGPDTPASGVNLARPASRRVIIMPLRVS